MAIVTIGGEQQTLPELNLRVMRLILPQVAALQGLSQGSAGGDDMANVSALTMGSCQLLGTWLKPPPRKGEDGAVLTDQQIQAWITDQGEQIEDRMTPREAEALGPVLQEALKEQGLLKTGESRVEEAPAADETSEAKSTTSSASSSTPASVVVAGKP